MDSRRPQKPRRLRGTYAYTASKFTALGVIGFSIGVMAINELLFHSSRKMHERYGLKELERANEESMQPLSIIPLRSTRLQEELNQRRSVDSSV